MSDPSVEESDVFMINYKDEYHWIYKWKMTHEYIIILLVFF